MDLSSRNGTKSSGSPYNSSLACAPNMTVCPASLSVAHRLNVSVAVKND